MKKSKQIAALPLRIDDRGRLRVLMVTSRDTGRWVMPKGWPMDGKKSWRAAEIEALEEAGAIGVISKEKLGTYRYSKKLDNGKSLDCRVSLYPMHVEKLKKKWPERKERSRKWFSPKRAAMSVKEPQLRNLLRELSENGPPKPMARLLKRAA